MIHGVRVKILKLRERVMNVKNHQIICASAKLGIPRTSYSAVTGLHQVSTLSRARLCSTASVLSFAAIMVASDTRTHGRARIMSKMSGHCKPRSALDAPGLGLMLHHP